MKKIKAFFAIVIVLVGVTMVASCGSSKKSIAKYSREDEMNEKIQKWTQEGWQIHGSTRTLRGKLAEHYAAMDANPDLYEVIGTSTGCRSITVCRAAALNAACVETAVKMGQDLKGKTMRDMKLDASSELPVEYDRFHEACISKFQASIKGDMTESIALISKNLDGVNNYEIYFLMDKQSARKRRKQAIEEALEESKLQQEYSKAVEKFINDDVE